MTPSVPSYLEEVYWWAYVRPSAVRFLDRQWLINTYLYGWYGQLKDATLEAFGHTLPGRTLQVSCCYGNLTPELVKRVAQSGGTLDVVDILPIQLENLRRKLPHGAPVRLLTMNAASLDLPSAHYDRVLLFFLLHEEPQECRAATLREALRVLKPEGVVVIVDYGVPTPWHPLRYVLLPFLRWLEPTARDFWKSELAEIVPAEMSRRQWTKTPYFGGLYQVLVSRG